MSKSSPSRFILLNIVSLIVFTSFSPNTWAATKISVLMVADTNDPHVREGLTMDLSLVKELFQANVPMNQLDFQTISGNNVSANGIVTAVNRLTVDQDDTLVFIYTGHGAFDTSSNEHYMTLMSDENLARSDIRKFLLSKNARTTVLISNSCSNFVQFDVNSPSGELPQQITPLFDELFIKTTGLVDISATMPGEYGMTGSGGSVFIRGLNSALGSSQRRVSWTQIIYDINQSTKKDELYANADQTAYAVKPLPTAPAPNPARNPVHNAKQYWLGAYTSPNPGGGVIVTKTVDKSPATRIRHSQTNQVFYLVGNRDIITHVNSQAVNTTQQFIDAIRASGKTATLTIYDRQTRKYENYYADLVELN